MRLPVAAAILVTLPAAACAPKEPSDATPAPVEVTVATEALSPYAIEVRWTTATETESPVAFDDGTGEETLLADAGDPVTDHIVLVQLLEAGATYSIRVGDGTGFTGTATEETPNAPGGPFNVLFDAAHGEDAGNADWVIDNDFPTPSPASPSSEASWTGAYSRWGFELVDTGRYGVESLRTGTFTAGNLSGFCAVILPEPNNQIPGTGLAALRDYVFAGGGALLIADHEGSDRDNDGWESLEALNELKDLDSAMGWSFDPQNLFESPTSTFTTDPREPLLHGPFGDVDALGMYAATTLRIVPSANDRMRPILWRPNQSGNAGLFVAAGFYGAGKFVLVGDSSGGSDGTANGGNSGIQDGWADPETDNGTFFLNATAWLCDDGG